MARPPQSTGFYYINYIWFVVKLFIFSFVSLPPLPSLAYWTIYSAKDFLFEDTPCSFFFIVQVSAAYARIRLTSVLYITILVFLESSCELSWLFSPKYDLLAAIRRFVISSETLFSPFNKEPSYAKLSAVSKLYLPVSMARVLLQFWVLAATIYLLLLSLIVGLNLDRRGYDQHNWIIYSVT